MSQQMDFDETSRRESPSYSTGYEEAPNASTPFSPYGQKLSGREGSLYPSAGQRVLLAIVSLVLLMLVCVAIIALVVVYGPRVALSLTPLFSIMFLTFVGAVTVINIVFNRKR